MSDPGFDQTILDFPELLRTVALSFDAVKQHTTIGQLFLKRSVSEKEIFY
jgi:hypothetical protein